ncbi:hypothetical protein BSL82_15760 [Tardibacter chloracetimidivorans]|uniref:Uncharacterized protein n=1 Tax=Tardibacter chloracetimidivorans TaxID=1921510 RepID=A0A1L3ZY51_9SPHN|nr:hypothetical protein [Tardibacter chloracetimidivorans]API60561.1 hypothetical protein BSL82_15760 [Tardibacter chloracetimidivorans]
MTDPAELAKGLDLSTDPRHAPGEEWRSMMTLAASVTSDLVVYRSAMAPVRRIHTVLDKDMAYFSPQFDGIPLPVCDDFPDGADCVLFRCKIPSVEWALKRLALHVCDWAKSNPGTWALGIGIMTYNEQSSEFEAYLPLIRMQRPH